LRNPFYRTSDPDAVLLTAMDVRVPLAAALAAALAAPVAASAQSPALQALDRCYVSAAPQSREPVNVVASGFMPNAAIDVFVDDVLQTGAVADPAGNVSGAVDAPYIPEGQRFFSLRLSDHAHPEQTVSASAKVTALSVTQSPTAPKDTHSRVRFRGRGFLSPMAPVYAHYVFRGKDRRTVRVAKPYGDCGLFSVRMRQFPFKGNPRPGVWTIQFDQLPAYNPQPQVYTTLTVRVRKVPGR
jgi:hypothetical protein